MSAIPVLFVKSIPKDLEGTYLGANSFMTGIEIFLGSLTAGYVSNATSYLAALS
jgi:hypothetical protein